MGEYNISNTTVTDLKGTIKDFSIGTRQLDSVNASGDTFYDNPDFIKYLSYYKSIPELKKSIDTFATYAVGRGFTADPSTKVILDHVTGAGEDTFDSIIWNLIVIKKINGDSFAEVMREGDKKDGVILNIKPLNPATISVVYGSDGRIKHYIQRNEKNGDKKLDKWRVLHLINDRIGDEIHGVSVVEACKWIIDARNEAMNDWRRISHRSTIRVMYIDSDNITKINQVKTEYAEAIKKGELLIIPAKRGEAEFEDLQLPPVDAFLSWIRYLENAFYQAVGVPKVVLGGSEEFTEASSKTALVTFDQQWKKEQRDLEADLWNQLALKIILYEPISLKNEMITDESKNTGQLGFQPNDVTANSGADGEGV